MIAGVGNDIIEVKRIEKAMEKGSFVKKFFTENEIEYLKTKKFSPQSAAGIFAAKEAVSKALGMGFRGFMPEDIEITHDMNGKPRVLLLTKADKAVEDTGISDIHLSISHCKEYASAVAVAEIDVIRR